jgi:hypothetical protein
MPSLNRLSGPERAEALVRAAERSCRDQNPDGPVAKKARKKSKKA